MKAWLRFLRVPLLPTVWSQVVAAGLIAGVRPDPYVIGAFSCLFLFGMASNDWCDREIDRLRSPSRPLASGKIGPRGAKTVLVGLFLLMIALHMKIESPSLRWAHATGLVAASLYNTMLKHVAVAGALSMAVTRASLYAGFDVPPPAIWLLGGYVFLVTLWSTTEEAHPGRKAWTLRFLLLMPVLDMIQVGIWTGWSHGLLIFAIVPFVCLGAVRTLR